MKKPTLLEVIQAVRSAAFASFRKTCAANIRSERLTAADQDPPTDDTLAGVVVPAPGPIAQLVVSCPAGLSEAVAAGILERTNAQVREPDDLRTFGLLSFLQVLEEHLDHVNVWYGGQRKFEAIASSQVARRTASGFGFLIVLETEVGALHVRMMLPLIERHTVTRSASEPATLTNEEREELIQDLTKGEVDVQVELPVARFAARLFPARLLGEATHRKHPVLIVASPRIAGGGEIKADGLKVPVYIVRSGRLLGFESSAQALLRLPITDAVSLPVLAIDLPSRIEDAQRRGAFRIVPRTQVPAGIGAWNASGGHVFAGEALDISFTGIRLLCADETASTFTKGDIVRVRASLPDPHGEVELPGVVRYVAAARGRYAGQIVGVEFLTGREWRLYEKRLDAVRGFVLGEQRGRAGNEAA